MVLLQEDKIIAGRYRVLRVLGRGYSGTVFLAEHTGLQALRAVKCISRKHVMYRQFLKEAMLLKNLKHPGIPLIYDLEEEGENLYIIEEYIEGESVQTIMLHQQYIPESTIIDYGIQLCEIIMYLHHMRPEPVLYLDLKPSHLLVNDGQLKLIDFGAVCRKSDCESYSLGTPGFAAPEQYEGELPDEKTDLYAIGAILFFMASGRTYEEKLSNEAEGIPISRKLQSVIKTCLNHEPGGRYDSVAELKRALKTASKYERQSNKNGGISSLISGLNSTLSNLTRNGDRKLPQIEYKATVIGVLGCRSGTGTTHLALMAAGYLSGARHKKTLLVQRDENPDYGMLQRACQGLTEKASQQKVFPVFGFTCCRNATHRELTDLLNEPYEMVIIDFGCDYEANRDEFKRCDRQIVTGSLCAWKREVYLGFLEDRVNEKGNASVLYTAQFAGSRELKEIAHLTKIRMRSVPFAPNPFALNEESRKFVRELLY
ncbi:serine/threonine protein kinase [Diplocloster modestus]|uniref:non-specific serine/threonine protein kinase n=1 Tax=Diplocloster modestus TaxID=2850322 RepID=A0ABS6K4J8_9FIRM|nr:serine/threonine protein kinase [Diplocloster modestus]